MTQNHDSFPVTWPEETASVQFRHYFHVRRDYDVLGQVQSGKKYWADGAAVPGQQFEYRHDHIGNRSGLNGAKICDRSAAYTPNAPNQYSSRTVPNSVDIIGIASADTNATLSVNVNGQSPSVSRHTNFFQASGTVNNANGPAWVPVTVTATRGTQTNAQPAVPPCRLLIPPANQTFTYDADGNLANDCLWSYTWDAENRLIGIESVSAVPPEPKRKLVFGYDWRSRRISKAVHTWDPARSAFSLQRSTFSCTMAGTWSPFCLLTSVL